MPAVRRDAPRRAPLPIDDVVPDVLDAVTAGRNVVVSAEPGAGKTTRVPPALLSRIEGEVIVLQPRRLAARLAARFVAGELGERPGGRVGYQVRFDRKIGPDTRLTFVTEGILTRRLREDRELPGVSVVIFDELHERSLDTDLGLSLLRETQRRTRPDLRIIAMSATLDAEPVTEFLDARAVSCGGRAHPVHISHDGSASDRPLGARVARALRTLIDDGLDGDVLVFLPGAREIREVENGCAGMARAAGMDLARLHGDLPPEEQDRAVRPGPRPKLILSTNVAETSVTVEGVVAVIDSGLARVAAHDPWAGLPTLALQKISRASAEQRAGRAGRIRAGRCLRLYSAADFQRRPAHDVPEVARLDLAGAVLDLAACGVADPAAFPWFEAPPAPAREAAVTTLRRLGAMDENGLTKTGRDMARLPVHPRLARVLIEARALGIPRLACDAVALWSERDIRRDRARPRPHGVSADVLSDLEDLWRLAGGTPAEALGLHAGAARHARRVAGQLHRALRGEDDPHVDVEDALAAATLSGFPDRVARVLGDRRLALCEGGSAELDPASVTATAELIVAVIAEQRRDRGRERIIVRGAVAIDAETILERREHEVAERVEVTFDDAAGRVVAHSVLRYGELVLDRSHPRALPGRARQVFVDAVRRAPRQRFLDEDELAQLLARVRLLVANGLAHDDLPGNAIDDVLERLAEEHDSFAEIRRANPVARLRAALSPEMQGQLDRLTPATVRLPGGRRLQVHYEADRPPWVESRLQDFFGSSTGPTIAGGRVSLVLHLLAPNQRAVQVTTDLAGFWERHYPELRKTLMRRYPRHAWPEDPLTAQPPTPGGRRRRKQS